MCCVGNFIQSKIIVNLQITTTQFKLINVDIIQT